MFIDYNRATTNIKPTYKKAQKCLHKGKVYAKLQLLEKAMTEQIPPPPEPPEDIECCNNGCEELCVFEIYKMQKADWERKYAHLVETTKE